jgi:hypothetical protein
MVEEGVRVEASTIVAKTTTPGKHFIYDLVRRLGVKAEEATQFVKVKIGADVEKGKILATKPGLLGSISIKAPTRGKVIAVEGGRMLYESAGANVELRAGFGGQVVGITLEYGVMIETTASLVQGVWGSGRADYGLIKMLSEDRGAIITTQQIDASCAGAILVGSAIENDAVLKAAAKAQAKGVILGGMSAALIPLSRTLPYPILLTEGFGNFPIADPTWTLLIGQNGREALLDGQPSDRWTGHRPELIVPLPTPYTPPPPPADAQQLTEGRRVRILRAPHTGSIGTIHSMPEHLQLFPSGIHTLTAYVDVAGEMILVPLDNLEVFE